MSDETETILIEPSFKAYGEYIAVAVVLLFYAGFGLLVFAWIWYDKASRVYEITPDKIVVRRKFLNKSVETMRIAKIREVIVKQGALQKPFDVGNVRILSTERAASALDIKGIPHPVQLKALLAKYQRDAQPAAAKKSA